MSDTSSAEEESRRRDRVRKKQKRTSTAVANVVAPPSYDDVALYDAMDEDATPVLRTIQDFAHQHVHTVPGSGSSKPSCEAADAYLIQSSSAAASLQALARPDLLSSRPSPDASALVASIQQRVVEEHRRACKVVPARIGIYQSLIDQLWKPVFFDQNRVNGDDDAASRRLEGALRLRQVRLPLMTSDLESELLAECGRFMHAGREYDFPACVNGDKCMGMQLDFPLGMALGEFKHGKRQRFVLTSLMYEEEYRAFITEDKPPPCRRPCIVCCRYTLVQLVGVIRSLKASASAEDARGAPNIRVDLDNRVYQLYYNLKDQPSGYFGQYMVTPRMGDDPLVDTMCKLSKESLRLCVTKEGRRYLDQSVMIYHKPVVEKPRVGESLQVFSTGADRR